MSKNSTIDNPVKPYVTVLMPVYNAERFLREAIDSIITQTFSDFEFLIIDDCSTDSSLSIIESYSDNRIRLVKNEKNLGVAATLNKGIMLASCELIARMDADDISYSARLEKQVAYFKAHPDCVLLYTFSRRISADRSLSTDKRFNTDHLFFNLLFHCPIRHPSVMYKRSAVMEVGMYDNTYVEDFNLWFRISRKYKLHHLPEILFEYRVTDTSTSRVAFRKESQLAYYRQVLSNIHYYTGPSFQISSDEVQFLRGLDLDNLPKASSGTFYVNCFRKLDFITQCVLQSDYSVLATKKSIKEAAQKKQEKLRRWLYKNRPFSDFFVLLLATGHWRPFLKNSLTKIKSLTTSPGTTTG